MIVTLLEISPSSTWSLLGIILSHVQYQLIDVIILVLFFINEESEINSYY